MACTVTPASGPMTIPAAAAGWRSRTSRWASRSAVFQPAQSVARSGPSASKVSQMAARSAVARLMHPTVARPGWRGSAARCGPTWPGRAGGGPPAWSALGDEGAGRDLGAVVEGGDLEVGEHVGHLPLQVAQALDGQRTDLDVGVLGGPHRDEVSPRPVVAGDDDAGLGGVGQDRAGRL